MAQSTPLFVGLDVHKDSIAVAHAQGQSPDPPVYVGTIGTRQAGRTTFLNRMPDANRVLDEIRRVAFADVRRLCDQSGHLKPISEWTDDDRAAIASIQVVRGRRRVKGGGR